jgi:hypothetical protein
MNINEIANKKNFWIVLLVGVSISVVLGLLITKKLLLSDSSKSKDYSKYFNNKYRWYKDEKTRNVVNKLHPNYRGRIAEFFSKIEDELGFTAYATSGYRSFKEQEALRSQNSSNAKAGYSSHNFGYAIDMNVKDKNGDIFLRKADSSKKWRDSGVVPLSEKLDLSWGGDGNFGSYHDPVHFYIKPNGKSTDQLRALVNDGKVDDSGYVLV